MTCGQRAFAGDSVLDTLHAITRTEPQPVGQVRADAPVELERILVKCLAKDRADRYQHADDLLVDLRNLARDVDAGTAPLVAERAGETAGTEAAPRAPAVPRALLIAAAFALGLLAGLVGGRFTGSSPELPGRLAVRLSLQLPGPLNASGMSVLPIAISPRGDKAAFVIQPGGVSKLYLRHLDRDENVPIPDTDGANNPFFSPDGNTIAYFARNSLMRISVEGPTLGVPVRITGVEGLPYGGTWADDDTIYFTTNSKPTPLRVPATGGVAEEIRLSNPTRAADRYAAPFVLPGGRQLLITIRERTEGGEVRSRVGLISLESGEERILTDGSGARLLASGHLVWGQPTQVGDRTGPLMVARFDEQRGELAGTAVPLPFVVTMSRPDGRPNAAVSDTGILIYTDEARTAPNTLVWVDRSGVVTRVSPEPGSFAQPRLSPDGSRIAYAVSDFSRTHLLDLDRGSVSELSGGSQIQAFPVWEVDGESLYLTNSGVGGRLDIYRRPAGGGSAAELVVEKTTAIVPMSVGTDGTLFYYEVTSAGERDIWALPPGGEPISVISTGADERAPMISPDGRYLAYVSSEGGHDEIYVRPWPEGDARYQISTNGGREPLWRRDGRELFYRDGDRMYAVSIADDDGTFRAARPELLFEQPFAPDQFGNPNYDISLDGERFLMVSSPAGDSDLEIPVVVDWFGELERLAPSGR